MALELLLLFCTFENSTNVPNYRSVLIPLRIAKRSICEPIRLTKQLS